MTRSSLIKAETTRNAIREPVCTVTGGTRIANLASLARGYGNSSFYEQDHCHERRRGIAVASLI